MSEAPTPPPDDLATTVYAHLRAIAQNQMKGERVGHTLTATALVNEAYMRLRGHPAAGANMGAAAADPRSRGLFLHAAAEAMRRILVEHARARGRVKRGGGAAKVSLDSIGDVADLASDGQADLITAFDESFRRLEAHDPRFADVVRMRFFAGLSVAETAEVLGVSARTVNNDWIYARAWLARDLQRNDPT